MADRPLLIFPQYDTAEREKEKPRFGKPNYHFPDFNRHRDILTPQFKSMQQAFISDAVEGIAPEGLLVIETIGKVEDFEKAVRKIEGLEWIAEFDDDEIKPDDDFYEDSKIGKDDFKSIKQITAKQSRNFWGILHNNGFIDEKGFIKEHHVSKNRVKKIIPDDLHDYTTKIIEIIDKKINDRDSKLLSGRLYLSMSNQKAREKLLSLWKSWDKPDKSFKRGYGKWKEIFSCMRTIRKWDVEDRIKDTGVIQYWKEELKEGIANIPFEIELCYYKNDPYKRKNIEKQLTDLILEENGRVLQICTIDEISFHAIKAELPKEAIRKVMGHKYIRLFKSDYVMFFKPAGQSMIIKSIDDGEICDYPISTTLGEPVAAILDGLPFANHELLKNNLVIDDPDDFESDYLARERKHGTAMAALVCHGDLEEGDFPLERPVYVRPVMKPDKRDFSDLRKENIPYEVFFEDIIERSVRRIFEGENGDKPVAPNVKIINLSICDPYKMFFNRLSSCAKLIDWLSEKHNVLFCISSGNIVKPLNFKKNYDEIKSLSDLELAKHTIKIIDDDIRNRRILAPGDSINAITVGAMHTDMSKPKDIEDRIDILPVKSDKAILPSPISAHGNGFRNSVKPEIYLPGGRQLYRYSYGLKDSNKLEPISSPRLGPGQKTATTPLNSGEKNRTCYTVGTSNSSALATRGAVKIFEVLNKLREEKEYIIPDANIAVLIKALLVHGAAWGNSFDVLKDCFPNHTSNRKIGSRYLGYGVPDIDRVLECTAQRATAIGSGTISKDVKHEFKLPLPPSLSNSKELRRLIITLAWFSPINPDSRKYRKANLSFDPKSNIDIINVARKEADWQQVKNGTVQHEIMEGDKITNFQVDDYIIIPVVCKEDAGVLDEEVNYGLAVTLEVKQGVNINIYDEIKARIEIAEQITDKV